MELHRQQEKQAAIDQIDKTFSKLVDVLIQRKFELLRLLEATDTPTLPCNSHICSNPTLQTLCVNVDATQLSQSIKTFGYISQPPTTYKLISNPFAIINNPFVICIETYVNDVRHKCGGLSIDVSILYDTSIDLLDAYSNSNIVDNADGTYLISTVFKYIGNYKLIILINDLNNTKLYLDIYAKEYRQHLFSREIKTSDKISDVATYHGSYKDLKDCIYVIIKDNIYVYDTHNSIKYIIGSSGSKQCEFLSPSGIYIKNDLIYVADGGNHRIQILTAYGKFVDEYKVFDHVDDYPTKLTVDLASNIIISGKKNGNKIAIINKQKTLTYITYDAVDIIIAIAVDSLGNIHVNHGNCCRITVYSTSGKIIRHYANNIKVLKMAIDQLDFSYVIGFNYSWIKHTYIFNPAGLNIYRFDNNWSCLLSSRSMPYLALSDKNLILSNDNIILVYVL